jgi:cell wall-associated NlpC family hydrolase
VSSVRPCLVVLGVSFGLAACSSVVERPADLGTSEVATSRRLGSGIVEIAQKYVGAPYRWGGSSPSGFDCSGLVRYVYAQVGVELPHNAAKQYALGAPVSREELLPGDIVFFDRLRHNGIYIGDGRFIHARQTGRRVAIAGLDEAWYAERWVGARRIEPLQPAGDDQER